MKAKAFLSAFAALLFGLIGYVVLRILNIDQAFLFACFAGLLFYLLLFPVLVIYDKVLNRRYAKFEKNLTSPIFYKTNGNFILGNGKVKNGNIYFCEAGIACVTLEEKPYALDEILVQDIMKYECDDIHLTIFATDGRIFVITVPDTSQVIEILRQKEWIV